MPTSQPNRHDLLRESAELFTESWLLTLDSAAVIWMRLGRLAALDAAALAEGERIIGEKTLVAMDWPWRLWTGSFGTTPHTIARRSLNYYRTRVSDNHRRLTGAKRRKTAKR